MKSTLAVRGAAVAFAIVTTMLVLAPARAPGQTKAKPERFTAFAVDLGVPGRASAGTVEIAVERWSTDAERDRLMNVLREQGPDKLLSELQKLPRVGYFRTPNSIGYDIHFARRHPVGDGEMITLMTDRYIGFWEAANRPRTIDYPFTLVEMQIGSNGTGEGKMSLATRIMVDKDNNTIVLEDYKSQPVLLNNVHREPATNQ